MNATVPSSFDWRLNSLKEYLTQKNVFNQHLFVSRNVLQDTQEICYHIYFLT